MQFPIVFPRIIVVLVAASCFVAAEVRGQKYEPVGARIPPPQADLFEVSVGYNYIHLGDAFPETRNLHGVDVSAFINITSWLSAGGDFMADFGSHTFQYFRSTIDVDSQRYVYIFGPRVTVWRNSKFRIFAEGLAGGVHAEAKVTSTQFSFSRTATASADDFAAAFGGGFDWRLTNHLSWRILQADYLGTNLGNQWQHNFRASTAIAYSFGQK